MTVVLSIAAPDMIIMAVDSAVMLDFGNSREYEQGRKSYMFPGIGCVTTWGSRDGNQIGNFLDRKLSEFNHLNVENLATLTYEYLTKEYQPDRAGLDDVGYHVSGFDNNSAPRLFHIFWGFDRPRPPNQIAREFKIYDHSPQKGAMFFLYNGRNDLASTVINTLLNEVYVGGDTKLNPSNPVDRVLLADLTLRFSSEITPQVGTPFLYFVISKANTAATLRNDTLTPINRDYVIDIIKKVQ
jgi:hypothetical protein